MSNKFTYFKNLQSKLDDRRCKIMMSQYEVFHVELKSFFDFLESVTLTKAVLSELESVINQNDFSKYGFGISGCGGPNANVPDDELKRIAFYYKKLREINGVNAAVQISHANMFRGGNSVDGSVQNFKDQIFIPFYSFIFEKVSDGDFLLYLLMRFKINAEFFDKKRLFDVYNNTKKEEDLDIEVRRFLFNEGIDYPYSKPRTASGEPDIVLNIEEKPIPLEVKIFDPERNYGKSRIIEGVHQAKRYADDYNQALGYLIVFNPSSKHLEIEAKDHPPMLRIGSKEIVILVVDINRNRSTASQEKSPDRETLKIQDFE